MLPSFPAALVLVVLVVVCSLFLWLGLLMLTRCSPSWVSVALLSAS